MSLIDTAHAQLKFPDIQPIDPGKFTKVSDVLLLVVNGLIIVAGLLAVIYIIWSGYRYIVSAGDPEGAQKARNGLLYAVIGIVVIALSYAIINAVVDLLKSAQGGSAQENTAQPSGGGNQAPLGDQPTKLPKIE